MCECVCVCAFVCVFVCLLLLLFVLLLFVQFLQEKSKCFDLDGYQATTKNSNEKKLI